MRQMPALVRFSSHPEQRCGAYGGESCVSRYARFPIQELRRLGVVVAYFLLTTLQYQIRRTKYANLKPRLLLTTHVLAVIQLTSQEDIKTFTPSFCHYYSGAVSASNGDSLLRSLRSVV